jgi:protein-tyrosine phosphatase
MKNYVLALIVIVPLSSMAQIADSSRREIKLEGVVNFRDLGGYATKDGRHVKWGKIYRSASLNRLTDADVKKLQGLSLARVADFRGPYEVAVAPDKLPSGALRISLPAGSENVGDSNYMRNMMRQVRNDSFMIAFYGVITPFKERYKPLFRELLTLNKDSSLLFHCTAGKDRTGIAAALVLYALGVNERTIMDDYLATNYYRSVENEKMINTMVKAYAIDEVRARNLMSAREDYLEATFASIKSKYGSLDNFLKTEMGLNRKKIKQLRRLYLD